MPCFSVCDRTHHMEDMQEQQNMRLGLKALKDRLTKQRVRLNEKKISNAD